MNQTVNDIELIKDAFVYGKLKEEISNLYNQIEGLTKRDIYLNKKGELYIKINLDKNVKNKVIKHLLNELAELKTDITYYSKCSSC